MPTSAPTEKPSSDNKKTLQPPRMNNIHYWTPSVEVGTALLLLKLFSAYLVHRENSLDEDEATCPNSQNYSDSAAEFAFFSILFCNTI